jgi:hypothetical protein
MANETQKLQNPDQPKKTDVDVEPLTDQNLDDVSGGICSLNVCSSGVEQ